MVLEAFLTMVGQAVHVDVIVNIIIITLGRDTHVLLAKVLFQQGDYIVISTSLLPDKEFLLLFIVQFTS